MNNDAYGKRIPYWLIEHSFCGKFAVRVNIAYSMYLWLYLNIMLYITLFHKDT